MKHKYIYRAHISERKKASHQVFCARPDTTQTAEMTGLNLNTVDRISLKSVCGLWGKATCLSPSKVSLRQMKATSGRRVKGNRGRGAGGKTIVFGLYKRDGKVYTEIVPDANAKTLQGIIRGQADIESAIHTDGWRGYDGLVDLGYEKHFRFNHSDNEFSAGHGRHINGIESFWGYAKHRLAKFKGIPKDKFDLHLKETEFRLMPEGKISISFCLKTFGIIH